jgi:tripartite-type tricarboxylate transporter receptor subunit TctC
MKVMFVFLAMAFILALASGAGAQPGEFVKGVLQPLADGFPKRPITIVNSDDAGSRDGIFCRQIQSAIRAFSPVDVLLSDEPAPSNATFNCLKDIGTRNGGNEGYYVMQYSSFGSTTEFLTEPIEKELGVKLSDLSMVIDILSTNDVFFTRKNAPWGKTFAGFVKYAKEHPGELKYISVDVGSGNDIRSSFLIQKLGIKVKKIPQGGHQEVASTIGAGQGDFTLGAPDIANTNWEAGRIEILMVQGDVVPPPWDKDPNIVSSKAAGIDLLRGGIRGFGLPSKVSRDHVEWLFKLFKAAATSDTFKNQIKLVPGINWLMLNPAESDELNKKILVDAEPVVRELGLLWDQPKKK